MLVLALRSEGRDFADRRAQGRVLAHQRGSISVLSGPRHAAPARAFARALSASNMHLIVFGCRHESKDRLYADEFAGFRNWKWTFLLVDIRTHHKDGT